MTLLPADNLNKIKAQVSHLADDRDRTPAQFGGLRNPTGKPPGANTKMGGAMTEKEQLQAENRVLKHENAAMRDILSRLVSGHLAGHLSFSGPLFGTWQRAVKIVGEGER